MSSQATERLFDEVLVVALKPSEAAGGAPHPEVLFHFHPQSDTSRRDTAVRFCFPTTEQQWLASESFTYTLTEDNGRRCFGFCRRLLRPPAQLPECICVLTKRQWFSLFSHVLDIIQLNFDLVNFVPQFVQAAYEQIPPRPGEPIIVKPRGELGQTFRLTTPEDNAPTVTSYELLFTSLGVVNVLRLVAALLHESRVIVIGQRWSDISTAAHCAMSLLNPFSWQHVLIPVLPSSMIDYVCAPMPFVVGVLEAHRHLLMQQPMEAHVVVELDRGRLRGDEGVPQLPRPYRDALFRRLEAAKAVRHGPKFDVRVVVDAFLGFYAELLHDWQQHLRPDAVRRAREALASTPEGARQARLHIDELFDHAAFVACQPPSCQEFLRALRGAQLWESWLVDAALRPEGARALSHFERKLLEVQQAPVPAEAGLIDARGKSSGSERARELAMSLKWAMGSTHAPALPAKPLALPKPGTPRGSGGSVHMPLGKEKVSAAVEQARATASAKAKGVADKLAPRRARGAHDSGLSGVADEDFFADVAVVTVNAPPASGQHAGQGAAPIPTSSAEPADLLGVDGLGPTDADLLGVDALSHALDESHWQSAREASLRAAEERELQQALSESALQQAISESLLIDTSSAGLEAAQAGGGAPQAAAEPAGADLLSLGFHEAMLGTGGGGGGASGGAEPALRPDELISLGSPLGASSAVDDVAASFDSLFVTAPAPTVNTASATDDLSALFGTASEQGPDPQSQAAVLTPPGSLL